MSIADSIRRYAMGPNTQDMAALEPILIEAFMTWNDWTESALWSVEWRTFALLVAEAIATDGGHP